MKKRSLSICLAFLLIFISGCNFHPSESTSQPTSPASSETSPPTPSPAAGTVQDYFPIRENVRYVYQGEGNEYASYDMYIDYTDNTHVQQRIKNGATEAIKIIEVDKGSVKCVFSQGEIYYRENFLDKTNNAQEVLLMEPIEIGTTWTLGDGRTRTITGVSVKVNTPSGSYTAVSVETKSVSGTTTDYYAKNIGLIKTVYAADNSEISSSLSEIQENVPFVQTVRFFYPNVNDGKLYYKDQEISFKTNDITREVLETAYKQQIAGQPGRVFSDNTKINSLYLNQDGMVYLDLSQAFVSEMNAGSGYEAMILQCVANTFGTYYGVEKVILTIDGNLYESGHIKLNKGEYLSVQTDGSTAIS